MKISYIKSESITGTIKSFWFKPEKKLRFIAGQAIELHMPHDKPDHLGEKRWFTISSSPLNDLISITTKIPPLDYRSTHKHALDLLKPGQILSISSPIGDFVLPKDPTIPLLFIAGGIGCTPYHSMLEYLGQKQEKRSITLIYGDSLGAEIAFPDLFATLGENFIPILGKRLNAEYILSLANPSPQHFLYLSGPEPMVEKLQADLLQHGIQPANIVADFFSGYTADQ